MADEEVKYKGTAWSESNSQSTSTTNQQSETKKVLDTELLNTILSGLVGQMTDEQINAFAENLLLPQLNAGLEAADQAYETTKLAKEQEKADLAVSLARAIQEQQSAYKQSMAGVETAALARGMGRSSYTLQTLANQGNALAQVVRQLTDESARQQGQLQEQISLAAQQQTQTKNRLNKDYAAQLAAKVQELRQNQQNAFNQNYMTAVSAALGSQTKNDSTTTGSSSSLNLSGNIENMSDYSGGAGTSSGTKKKPSSKLPTVSLPDDVDVISHG